MKSTVLLVLVVTCGSTIDGKVVEGEAARRPFYLIAHMANSVKSLDKFLADGANAIEVDISFDGDGNTSRIYHGSPCDNNRNCEESTKFVDYLQAAATRNFCLLFFDIKCADLNDTAQTEAGVDIAKKLMEHFWKPGGSNASVVLSVPTVEQKYVFKSFADQMRILDPTKLSRVTYDIAYLTVTFREIIKMYKRLGIKAVWQGDGDSNWFEPSMHLDDLKKAIQLRDSGNHIFKKVHRWTVDPEDRIRTLMEMGLDGIMTNRVDKAANILKDIKHLRLATSEDNINERFKISNK